MEEVLDFSAITKLFTQDTEVETTQGSDTPLDLLADETLPALSTVYDMVIDLPAVQEWLSCEPPLHIVPGI